jgi:hypothetical protein
MPLPISPLKFSKKEYNVSLDLYQKWLHGNKDQQIEKIYSLAAFHLFFRDDGFVVNTLSYQKYAEYLYVSVYSILQNTNDWYVRIYIDESVLSDRNPETPIWRDRLEKLIQYDRVQLICVKFPKYYIDECHQGLLGVMFRYLTLFDPNVSIILFRDLDNIWTDQHQHYVDEWLRLGTDVYLFLNSNYKRQHIQALSPTGVILEERYYTTILSGLWNIRKPMGVTFSSSLWQKMFAYIESYTDFVFNPEFKTYKYYGNRFIYGFDEIVLTRIAIPIFIQMGLKFHSIPIKIYDLIYFNNMFENPLVARFLRKLSDEETIKTIKNILIDDYWKMFTNNTGLSQYILCIITNIYFGIANGKSKFYNTNAFINSIRNKIIPNPLLMSIGIFTFKNFKKYNWFPIEEKRSCGADIVKKFLETNQKITIEEWTAIATDTALPPSPSLSRGSSTPSLSLSLVSSSPSLSLGSSDSSCDSNVNYRI